MLLTRLKRNAGRHPMLVGLERRYELSGDDVVRLMNRYHVTLHELKARTQITLKRIREVRATGLTCRETGRDWIQAITGADPGPDWSLSSLL